MPLLALSRTQWPARIVRLHHRPAAAVLLSSRLAYSSALLLSASPLATMSSSTATSQPAALRKRPVSRDTAATGSQKRSHSHHSHHSHTDSHGAEEAEQLLTALRGKGDRGSRVTLIGLGANVALTAVKGAAGWMLSSAVLLADAAHSGSDLIADIVTLVTYRLSRRPVDGLYPYGYGKYETLGSLVISSILITTAFAIGFHSYHSLLTALSHISAFSPELLATLDAAFPGGHSHGPDTTEVVDARAMYFAGASVIVKEYLYRMTLKVAKEEHSNVLLANAFHHRSDAFGSLVAVVAIGGSWLGFPVLDPLGGLLVAGAILKNGIDVGIVSLKALVDQVSDPTIAPKVYEIVAELRDSALPPLSPFHQDSPTTGSSTSHSHSHADHLHPPSTNGASGLPILAVPSIRVFSSGPALLIDIQLELPSDMTLATAAGIEKEVRDHVKAGVGARCREVVVRMKAAQSA